MVYVPPDVSSGFNLLFLALLANSLTALVNPKRLRRSAFFMTGTIKLPDGSVIKSISEEGVEAFKTDYILSYYDNVTQTFQDETQFFT